MSTTVRVENETKAELDRLQGLVQMETGRRISQSELLARLLRHAAKNPGMLYGEPKEWVPPTREQLARFFEDLPDYGVETDATRIDEELYERE